MTIGVFFGNRNPEHDVSIVTGQLIISELKKLGHTVLPVYLDKKGRWYVGEALGSLKFFTEHREARETDAQKFFIDLEESRGKLVFKKKGLGGKRHVVDLAFPAFHGQNGEDGVAQGFFEMFNVPYVGCDVTSSAVTMDKVLTKLLYERFEMPTTPFVYFMADEWEKGKAKLVALAEKKIRYPMFVKPSRLGSSIAVAKVNDRKELETAVAVALKYDDKAIVEKAVENMMDITVAVAGHSSPVASLIQEAVFQKDLFSYEDKYIEDGGAQLGNAAQRIVIPARLTPKITEEVRSLAVEIFKKLGCSGIARVDFLYDTKARKYYANEVNTLPGTLYHHLWKASGMEMGELLKTLITAAEERHRAKEKLMHSFESNILSFANSVKLKMSDEDNGKKR